MVRTAYISVKLFHILNFHSLIFHSIRSRVLHHLSPSTGPRDFLEFDSESNVLL